MYTLQYLYERSEPCYNRNSYTTTDWQNIAKWLYERFGYDGAFAVLDSKHMRWCEDHTFEGFVQYANSNITQSEVTNLTDSYEC
jgi:hypothetical protein